jgi:hypothetical protein
VLVITGANLQVQAGSEVSHFQMRTALLARSAPSGLCGAFHEHGKGKILHDLIPCLIMSREQMRESLVTFSLTGVVNFHSFTAIWKMCNSVTTHGSSIKRAHQRRRRPVWTMQDYFVIWRSIKYIYLES